MKKCRWLWAIIFCLALALGLTACGEGANQPLTFQTLVFEDNRAQLTVSNATESFSFADEIKATGSTKFAVSSDEYGQNTFLTKVVPLAEGDNVFYVFAMNGEEITQTYTVTIRRRPMYTVSFEGFEWGEEQLVEEGGFATVPQKIPTKDFYTFDSWDYDFTQPITEYYVHVKANWTVNYREMFLIEGTTLVCMMEDAKDFPLPVNFWDYLGEITAIGERAFGNCPNLKEIIIPDSVINIEDWAFIHCKNLTKITIPDSVTSIGDDAFVGCTSLTKIVIPNSVISIDNFVFSGCTNLNSITLPDSLTSIGNGAFCDCTSLTSITIPDSVTFIGFGAFAGCDNLAEITLPFVGETKDGTSEPHFGWIFGALDSSKQTSYLPENLKNVTITSATNIGYKAFENCTNLTNITIGNGVTSIGAIAFKDCDSLTSITIPDSVTSIGVSSFYGCSNLTSVTIGNGVTAIEDFAFDGCASLTHVYYHGTESEWEHLRFNFDDNELNPTTIYYYSESEPTVSGNFWYYDENGVIAIW